MSMSQFIEDNLEPILSAWEKHAESLTPAAEGLTKEELRDLAEAVLRSVVEDMKSQQTEQERHDKSVSGLKEDGGIIGEQARAHAAERLTEGFTLNQLVAEYRALRASVIDLWREQGSESGAGEMEELTRFNEAIDESLVESVGWYNSRIEDARDLLNAVLAHDMRNPLGSIMVSTEVLLHDEALSPQNTQATVRIRNSGNRLSKMISELLDFTRTRLGTGLPIETERADLAEIVRNVVEELEGFHPAATIDCQIEGDLAGRWDVSRMEQMLSNLISNALEHGRPGLPVTVTARALDGEVVVSVHNSRDGIPEEAQKVIFDPLRRAHLTGEAGERPRQGLGIGLYIARQIVEAHSGSIGVESSDEEGTTFTVHLPRQPERGSTTAGMT